MTDTVNITHRYSVDDDANDTVDFTVDFPKKMAPSKMPDVTIEYRVPKTTVHEERIIQSNPIGYGGSKEGEDEVYTRLFGFFDQKYFMGTVTIRVEWIVNTSSNQQTAEKTYDAGNTVNAKAKVPIEVKEVQLSHALMLPVEADEEGEESTEWSTALAGSATERGDVVADILSHLHKRLWRGLGYLWHRADSDGCCRQGNALRNHSLDSIKNRQDLEECWAQHIAELTVATPYMGPATNMGAPKAKIKPGVDTHKQDAWLFQQCIKEPRPTYPLMYECQQLSTMALICLGYDDIVQNPLSAGAPHWGNLPDKTVLNTKSEYEQWTESGWPSAKKTIENEQYRLGSCLYYINDKNTSETKDDFPHVGCLIRALKSKKLWQMIDTRAWIYDTPFNFVNTAHGYNIDTPYRDKLTKDNSVGYDFKGVMIPPAATDDQLKNAIRRMRRAVGIGAVRLVIRERKDKKRVVWMSRLLLLQDGAERYSLARLMVALRGCPYRKDLTVEWHVIVPMFESTLKSALAGEHWWNIKKPFGKYLVGLLVDTEGLPQLKSMKKVKSSAFKSLVDNAPLGAPFSHNDGEPDDPKTKYGKLLVNYPLWADMSKHEDTIPVFFGGKKPGGS